MLLLDCLSTLINQKSQSVLQNIMETAKSKTWHKQSHAPRSTFHRIMWGKVITSRAISGVKQLHCLIHVLSLILRMVRHNEDTAISIGTGSAWEAISSMDSIFKMFHVNLHNCYDKVLIVNNNSCNCSNKCIAFHREEFLYCTLAHLL